MDAEGPDALTFRRLAAEFDTGVGTFYWHVANKSALMSSALDVILEEVDDDRDERRDGEWRTALRQRALALWMTLCRHPWAARVAVTSAERSPRMLRFWDRGAALLFAGGFPAEDVAYSISALRTYVMGSSMQNAAWRCYGEHPARAAAGSGALLEGLPSDRYPNFEVVAPILADHCERTQFLRGLDAILTGIARNAVC